MRLTIAMSSEKVRIPDAGCNVHKRIRRFFSFRPLDIEEYRQFIKQCPDGWHPSWMKVSNKLVRHFNLIHNAEHPNY